MYLSTCDPRVVEAVPRSPWARFPWSDSGMQSAETTAGSGWAESRQVMPMLWEHFQAANELYKCPIALIELGSLKRYADDAGCPVHADDPQPLSHGRLLSLSVVLEASPDLSGGALMVREGETEHRVDRKSVV